MGVIICISNSVENGYEINVYKLNREIILIHFIVFLYLEASQKFE